MYRIATAAVENAAIGFDKEYSYYVPEHLEPVAAPGCRATVPFGGGNRRRTAIILTVADRPERDGLKPLFAVLDQEPLLGDEGLALLRIVRERTFCTWFDAFRALVPAGFGVAYKTVYSLLPGAPAGNAAVEYLAENRGQSDESDLCRALAITPGDPGLAELVGAGYLAKTEVLKRRVADEKELMVRVVADAPPVPLSPKQKQALAFLTEAEAASLKEVCYYAAVTRTVVDALVRKGRAEYYDLVTLRNPYGDAVEDDAPPPALSARQQAVFEGLRNCFDNPGKPALLYGVTGSGKTEVFLRLIEHVIGAGKRVICLVPEISLTAQQVESFHRRFGKRVAVLHSGLSLGERMDEWRRIRRGGADIVVGTRSAVFAPLENIGLVVVDEEQEHTYKSDRSPRYHAREIARIRCEYHGALLLLCSATPSVESFYWARQGRYRLFTLDERFNKSVLPDVVIVDMADGSNISSSRSFSLPLLEELHYNLSHGEQSILLLNRRGYNTVVKCSSCGAAAGCPNCSVSLTYHAANDSLLCHYCGFQQNKITSCPGCGSQLVRYAGAGTQKLEEELAALFPEARVLRVDMDTTMSKFAHQKLFSAFAAGEYDIMIGTQMVAKGHNFPGVTLVGVLGADGALYAGDFRSYERAFALLTQVVGRGGRGGKPGRAVIQTYSPENPVLRLAAKQDYHAFFAQEIALRKHQLYPPFCQLCGVGFAGEDHDEVKRQANRFAQRFREIASAEYPALPVRLLGPTEAEVARAAGKYRYKLLLKCKNTAETRALLWRLLEWFAAESKKVTAYIDMHYDRI